MVMIQVIKMFPTALARDRKSLLVVLVKDTELIYLSNISRS